MRNCRRNLSKGTQLTPCHQPQIGRKSLLSPPFLLCFFLPEGPVPYASFYSQPIESVPRLRATSATLGGTSYKTTGPSMNNHPRPTRFRVTPLAPETWGVGGVGRDYCHPKTRSGHTSFGGNLPKLCAQVFIACLLHRNEARRRNSIRLTFRTPTAAFILHLFNQIEY